MVTIFPVLSTVSWTLVSSFIYNLDSSIHIEYVYCTAFKTLGFIMRLSEDSSRIINKNAFYAFVRLILEYVNVVWDHHTAINSRQLERVQRRFLCLANFILKIPCTPRNYKPVPT